MNAQLNSNWWKYCVLACTLAGGNLVYAQGCEYARCAPNPVPCAQCISTWTDNYSWVWSVSSPSPGLPGTYNVSGSVTAPPVAPGCPYVTWQVSGTIVQHVGIFGAAETDISWNATNPNPSYECDKQIPDNTITMTGQIANDSCDYASGTWSAIGSPNQNGNFTMTKPADSPGGSPTETSTAVGWWSVDPTIAYYEQTIGSSKNLAGRQAFEDTAGATYDYCWFSGSIYEPVTGVTGSGWFVGFYYFDNRWDYDYVGFPSVVVTYYRNHGRAPCEVIVPQGMSLYTYSGSAQYFTDTLYYNIPDMTNYGVARAGVQAWRTWP